MIKPSNLWCDNWSIFVASRRSVKVAVSSLSLCCNLFPVTSNALVFSVLEMVQSRAARYVLNRFNYLSSVDEMLQELQWNTLEERRKKDRLVMFYKIHNDQTGIDTRKYLKPLGRVSRHVNNQAYEVPFAFTDYYKFSYFPRTINEWNVLPNETVNASSLTAFTNYL